MQPLLRTSSVSTHSHLRFQPRSRRAAWISFLLAMFVGCLGESVSAGSENGSSSTANDFEQKWSENGSFRTLAGNQQSGPVLVRSVGEPRLNAVWNFVIAHGLGGTVPEDRFCQLALEIKRRNPDANVLLLDWSSTATLTSYGIPRVWHIAGCLDDIAADAAASLSSIQIDPSHTTLIGESFGVYILGHIAKCLGGVKHILAFNPANEAGGYEPASLCICSERSWSFHTFSAYDTTRQIAHADFLLETPETASIHEQHIHGIQWLTRQLRSGDTSWLKLDKSVPPACAEVFSGIALEDGRVSPSAVPRIRPAVADKSSGSQDSSHESLIASSQMKGLSK